MTLTFKVARLGTTNFQVDTGPAAGSWTSISSLVNSQANLAGNYLANQSWVVIGTLEDKFTRTEFMVNVPTESVVLSYDRSGVGVNKIRERGALDVKGDIYANDQPIQQHQLTRNNGISILTKESLDNILKNGMYYSHSAPDRPRNQNGWLLVQVYDDAQYIVQTYWTATTETMLVRYRMDNRWGDWKEIATKDDIQKSTQGTPWQVLPLQNSWVHHPEYDKVQYSKTFDGVVYIRGTAYKGRTTKETVIGVLPVGFRPKQTMFVSALNNSYGTAVLGLYSSGNIVVKGNVDATWLNFDNVSFKI